MDRDIPVFNRPVIDKINRKNQERHLQRLRNIKSGNGNRTMPIGSYNHTLSNKKGIMAVEHKQSQIEKQNVMLFNKMMQIMKRNDPHNQPSQPYKLQQISRVNKIAHSNTKIMEQNKGIFERLEQQKPTISNKKLYEDRAKNLSILRFLGKYPNPNMRINYDSTINSQLGRQTEHRKNYDEYYIKNPNLQQFALDETALDEQIRGYQEQVRKMKQRGLQTSGGRRKFLSQAINRHRKTDSEGSQRQFQKIQSAHMANDAPKRRKTTKQNQIKLNQQMQRNQPNKQIILFQKRSVVDKLQAMVQIIRLYNIYKIRAVLDESIRGQSVYQLQIPQDEGNQFFSQNNYDYAKICKMLVIEDGSLVVNPNLHNLEMHDNLKSKPSDQMLTQTAQKQIKVNGFSEPDETKNWAKYQQALEEYIE